MKILIPHLPDGNTYILLLANALRGLGQEVVRLPLGEGLAGRPEVLWIQWPEHLSLGTPPTQTALVAFDDLLDGFARRGGIVAWTVHNLAPHGYAGNAAFRSLYEIMAAHARVQIHHGEASVGLAAAAYPERPADAAIKVAGHGGYWNLLGNSTRGEGRRKLGLPAEGRVLLAFGGLRSRGELEMVLQAATTGWEVVLAGRLPKLGWTERAGIFFQRRGVGKRLHVLEGRIADSEVDGIVKACDAMLIARKEMLNSGNVFLGLTFGRALIGPGAGNVGEVLRATGNFVFDAEDGRSLHGVLREALGVDLEGPGSRNAAWIREHGQWEAVARAMLDGVGEVGRERNRSQKE